MQGQSVIFRVSGPISHYISATQVAGGFFVHPLRCRTRPVYQILPPEGKPPNVGLEADSAWLRWASGSIHGRAVRFGHRQLEG